MGLQATEHLAQSEPAIEQGRLSTGEGTAARAVRGLTWTGDRLYALLAFPRRPEANEGLSILEAGGAGTLRSIDLLPDGSLRARGDLDIAANFNTGAAHRPVIQGALIAISTGPTGVTLARRASGRGVFADLFVPWVGAPR